MSQTNPSVRVAIVQRVVPGYRIPVFNAVADLDGVELTVIHGSNPLERPRGNTDFDGVDIDFDRREVPTLAAQPFGLHLVWLRGVVSSLRDGAFDVYICPASPSILSVVGLAVLRQAVSDSGLVWWGRSLGEKRAVSTAGGFVRRATEYARRPLYQAGDCCLCYGTAAAEFFQSYGVSPTNTYLAFNSTDTETLDHIRATRDADTLQALRADIDAVDRELLTFVGTHTSEKNIDMLVDVQVRLLARGYRTSLLIAGSGPETERLREYAVDVPHVHFTGYLGEADLAEYLLATDLFVMPGHGGLAVQQAMTLDNPVVTTPLDGTECDLVEEGKNGYVVPHDDIRSFTDRVAEILTLSPVARQSMGEHSRAIVEDRVNLDRMVEGFRRAIEDAAGRSIT